MKRPSSTLSVLAYAAVGALSLFPASFTAAAERVQNLPPPQATFSHDAPHSADGPPIAPLHTHVPLPPHGPAPLLYVRLSGPPGLHITFYPGPLTPLPLPHGGDG